jgi:hypothetical protein
MKLPPLTMAAEADAEPTVISTVSPTGAVEPAVIVPDTAIDAAPAVIDCEGETANVVAASCAATVLVTLGAAL